ncbi:hypothetical protein N9Q05_01975, partial [bacterium]|nr:hypothetical protein [bacterium]
MANEFKIKKGLIVTGASGGTVVDIQGSQGQLFSVTDDLSGSIFAVSDISGVPILDVNSSGLSTFSDNVVIGSVDSVVTGLNIGEASPTIQLFDTTNDGKLLMYMQDSSAVIGTYSNHSLKLFSDSTLALTINTSQNATFVGSVVTPTIITDNVVAKTTSGNITFKNNGGNTIAQFANNKSATFQDQVFATVATSSGDGSSTLTTKGYVDGLITGATIYRGAWDPSGGGYGSPDLSGVTQTSGYYYICSAAGTAEPNGTGTEPDTWAVGDWVIYNDVSGTGQWQKIDNSSVLSGAGTGQTVALWEGAGSVTDSETLGNSIITQQSDDEISILSTNATTGQNGKLTIYSYDDGDTDVKNLQLTVNNGGDANITNTGPYLNLTALNYIKSNNVHIFNQDTFMYYGKYIRFLDATSPQNSWNRTLGVSASDVVQVGGIAGYNTGKGQLALFSNNAQAMFIDEDQRVQFNAYDSTNNTGTPTYLLGTDASGNVVKTNTVPGSGAGPYLPLSAGSSYPLTGDLYQTMGTIGVAQTDQDYIAKIYELNSDGFLSLYTGQPTPLEKVRISSYGNSWIDPANNGNVGIGTTSPDAKLDIEGDFEAGYALKFTNTKGTGSVSGFRSHGTNGEVTSLYRNSTEIQGWNENGNSYFNGGNVGIGTASPQSKLHIVDTDGANIILNSNTGAENNGIWMTEGGVATPYVNGAYFHYDSANNLVRLNTGTTTLSTRFVVQRDTGKFIVGGVTANQTQSVMSSRQNGSSIEFGHLNQSGRYYGTLGAMSSSGSPFIAFSADNSVSNSFTTRGAKGFVISQDTGISGDLIFSSVPLANTANQGLVERMRINSSGNVGIGTASPSFGTGGGLQITNATQANLRFTDTSASTFITDLALSNDDFYIINRASSGQLKFRVNASNEAMTIDSNGNVGIGTTSPIGKLNVSKDSTTDGLSQAITVSSSSVSTKRMNLGYVPGSNYAFIDVINYAISNTNQALSLQPNGGNVGIGTTSPTNLLSLRKDVAGGDVAIYLQNYNSVVGSTDETVSIKFAHGNDGGSGYVGAKIVGGKEGDFESNPANVKGFMSFYTNEGSLTSQVEQMRINGDGNVGIGTTTPLAKLDIQGTQGQLFSVTDDLSGSIFAVADISGVPIFDVNSSGVSTFDGDVDIKTSFGGSNFYQLGVGTTSSGSIYTEGRIFCGGTSFTDGEAIFNDKVGIGTTNPQRLLSISNNDATTTPQLLITQNGSGDAVIGFNRPGHQGWAMGIDSSIGNNFEIHNSSGGVDSSSQLAITPGGNVGIGTTSPGAKLDVVGDVYLRQTTFTNIVRPYSTQQLTLLGGGANTLFINGNVGIGTTSPTSALGSTKVLDISSTGNGEVILDHTDAGTGSDLGLYSWARSNDHLAHIKATCEGATDAAFISFHAQPSGGSFTNAASNEKMRISSSGNVTIQ